MDDLTPQLPQTTQNKFYLFVENWKKELCIAAALVIVALFVIIAGGQRFISNQFFTAKNAQADRLEVVRVNPVGAVSTTERIITITFNMPVEVHRAEEFISVFPEIRGHFEQGVVPNEVVFIADENLWPGAFVTISIKEGLPSDTGTKLERTTNFSFSTRINGRLMLFKQGDSPAKFMAFSRERGTDITVDIGSEIHDPHIRIYRVPSPDIMLQSFTYSEDGSDYRGQYVQSSVATSSLTHVQDIDDIDKNSVITFRNEVGLYLFEALDGEQVIQTVWVSLNDTGIFFRQDDQKIILAAQNMESGRPESGVVASLYTLKDGARLLQQTTLSGIQSYPFRYPAQVDLIVARKGNDTMIIPVALPNSQSEIRVYRDLSKDIQMFLYTDRPIYRQGDIVKFRGLARVDEDAAYALLPAGTPIRAFIKRAGSNGSDINIETTSSAAGTFFGELRLPPQIAVGRYYLNVTNDTNENTEYGQGSVLFEVAEYKKPLFGLTVALDNTDLTRGDKVSATISGTYFDGRPLANQEVNYQLYRRDYYETEKAVYSTSFNLNSWGGMCGDFGDEDEYYGERLIESEEVPVVRLDANGRAIVEYNTKELRQSGTSHQITVVATKQDSTANNIVAAGQAIVHGGEYNIFFRPASAQVVRDMPFAYYFYAEKTSGERLVDTTFSYKLLSVIYGARGAEKNEIKSGEIKTDGAGIGIISETLSSLPGEAYAVTLIVSTQDTRGNTIEASRYIDFIVNETRRAYRQTVLSVSSPKGNLTPGERASLVIESPTDMTIFLTFERGRIYDPQWFSLHKGRNEVSFDVPGYYMPSVTPTLSYFYKGKYYIEGLSLNVPALKKELTIKIIPDKDRYRVGDVAHLVLEVTDRDGNPVSASVGIAVVDKAIFALRKRAAPPIHSSLYYFRGRSTNAASSLSSIFFYGGDGYGGGGGDGGSLFSKDIDMLYWNPELATDKNGRLTLDVGVGVAETTWNILAYAVTSDTKVGQGEAEFLVNN